MLGISSVLGVTLTARFYADAVEAAASGRDLLRFIEVSRAANLISAERGPTNAAVAAAFPSAVVLDRLAASRARTDAALALLRLDGSLSGDAAAIQADVAAARAVVEGVMARPAADRTPDDVRLVIDRMFAVADASQVLVEVALRPIAARPGSAAAQPALLIRLASDLRDFAGRMGSALMVPIAAAAPISAEQRTAVDLARGRVLELGRMLNQTSLADNAAVRSAWAGVQAGFFDQGMEAYDTVLKAGRSGIYPWDREAFTQRLLPSFATLDRLRDTLADQASIAIRREGRRARLALGAVAAVTALMVALECILLVAASRLIFAPLLRARDGVMALAAGESGRAFEAPVRGEIGDLFAALRDLGQRLQEREALHQENVALAERLRRLADTDALTGLLNRGALERLVHAWLSGSTEPRPIGLILFDIDHFKAINDGFGHAAGDVVLRLISDRLSAEVPPGGVLARFGGEEFAVVLADAAPGTVADLAEQLRLAILPSLPLPNGLAIQATASFGCATFACDRDLWPKLVEAADAALYGAKRKGRNAVVTADVSLAPSLMTAA